MLVLLCLTGQLSTAPSAMPGWRSSPPPWGPGR